MRCQHCIDGTGRYPGGCSVCHGSGESPWGKIEEGCCFPHCTCSEDPPGSQPRCERQARRTQQPSSPQP